MDSNLFSCCRLFARRSGLQYLFLKAHDVCKWVESTADCGEFSDKSEALSCAQRLLLTRRRTDGPMSQWRGQKNTVVTALQNDCQRNLHNYTSQYWQEHVRIAHLFCLFDAARNFVRIRQTSNAICETTSIVIV